MRRYWLLVYWFSLQCLSERCLQLHQLPLPCCVHHLWRPTLLHLRWAGVWLCQWLPNLPAKGRRIGHMFSCVLKKTSILNIKSWSIETNIKKTIVEQMWKKNLYMTFCAHLFDNGTWVCSCISLWFREKEKINVSCSTLTTLLSQWPKNNMIETVQTRYNP